MDLFGAKFTLALGAWRLRFVLMLEDPQEHPTAPAPTRAHHLLVRDADRVR